MTRRRLGTVTAALTAAAAALVGPASAALADSPNDPPIVAMPSVSAAAAIANAPSQPNMTYHGGPIQKNPKVYVSFWGWPATLSATETTYRNTLTGFLNNLGGTSEKAIDTQYTETSRGAITNPTALYGGAWSDTTAIPATPTQTDLANAALRLAAHFGSSADAAYLIATPHGHGDAGFVAKGGGSCAWHSYTGTTAYINLPYQLDAGTGCNPTGSTYAPVSIVAYHELTETNTDPLTNAWYAGDLSHEDADKCAWGNGGVPLQARWFGSNQYWVQPNWSNRDGQCEYFFLPSSGSTTSSKTGTVSIDSVSASCSFSRGYTNTGTDGTLSTSLTVTGAGVPISSSVFCDILTTDPTAPDGYESVQATGGANTKSISNGISYAAYGAKGSSSVCLQGSVTFASETVSVPYKCFTV